MKYEVTSYWYENVECCHYQVVEAETPQEAARIATENYEDWSEPSCDTVGDGDGDSMYHIKNLETEDETEIYG